MAKKKTKNTVDVDWNIKMQQIYPLGNVDAIWHILERMYSGSPKDEQRAVEEVMGALEKYDKLMRAKIKKAGF